MRSIRFQKSTVPLGIGEARARAYRRVALRCSQVFNVKGQKHDVGTQTDRHSTSSNSFSRVSKAE